MRSRRHAGPLDEQGVAREPVQAHHDDLGQIGNRLGRGQDQRDPLRVHATSHETQGVHRLRIEPLDVVDHAQHRSLLADVGEQAEYGECDQEPAGALRGLEPEGASEGRRLQFGDRREMLEHGPEQLVESGEGESGLGLDPDRTEHAHV